VIILDIDRVFSSKELEIAGAMKGEDA